MSPSVARSDAVGGWHTAKTALMGAEPHGEPSEQSLGAQFCGVRDKKALPEKAVRARQLECLAGKR